MECASELILVVTLRSEFIILSIAGLCSSVHSSDHSEF